MLSLKSIYVLLTLNADCLGGGLYLKSYTELPHGLDINYSYLLKNGDVISIDGIDPIDLSKNLDIQIRTFKQEVNATIKIMENKDGCK